MPCILITDVLHNQGGYIHLFSFPDALYVEAATKMYATEDENGTFDSRIGLGVVIQIDSRACAIVLECSLQDEGIPVLCDPGIQGSSVESQADFAIAV